MAFPQFSKGIDESPQSTLGMARFLPGILPSRSIFACRTCLPLKFPDISLCRAHKTARGEATRMSSLTKLLLTKTHKSDARKIRRVLGVSHHHAVRLGTRTIPSSSEAFRTLKKSQVGCLTHKLRQANLRAFTRTNRL